MFQGTVDKLCDIEGAFDFYQESTNVKDKTLVIIDNLWHAVIGEEEIYEIEDIIHNWLSKRI